MVNTIEERNLEIANIFIQEFDAPVQILTAYQDDEGVIYGNLLSSGDFYTYAFDEESIGVVHHEQETEELNEYAEGLLAGYGVKTDSDSPIEYTFGMLRIDAQVRCNKGGTPCGKVCLPKGSVCRKYGSGGGGGGKLKSGGGAALGAGIAGGVALAGTAGAAGTLAYINRKNLATGGKAVAGRLKRAGQEGYSELKTGLSGAKMSLKAGFEAAKELDKNIASAEKQVPEKEKSKARMTRRVITNTTAAGGVGGAIGSTSAGVENAARAVGRNLKAAGEDIKTTAKNSANTTARAAKNVKETFFGKKTNTNSQQATPIDPQPIKPPTASKEPKRQQVTVIPVPQPKLPQGESSKPSQKKPGRPRKNK
ncbi:hypothetical protein VF04_03790 [Nostoc linckia z7]|uniref:Uncharacterized protein n=2 Tax=Nostoc linckia TaxID=92942 RepID=A0A9Q5ZFX2_NOSLI|nr:hypothetical protein [Nostoc linckia]PHK42979.1 hypothetical protein VF12_01255 [Nostoc linckia z15]PHK48136.1 hypothetical protein VF13_02230 [Nostoc linckia z16]PHJ64920.1 hypothetical protein VF02_11280 [Nostoc linckia z1]PHJ70097.1 hypothetical protein VF05_11435 [Nostoc linckia z3]PHJ74998.1 hypothetical protein VF03_11595 [Nostoc linckia z2]